MVDTSSGKDMRAWEALSGPARRMPQCGRDTSGLAVSATASPHTDVARKKNLCPWFGARWE
eukprot:10805451-Alexandrium_andersonii.AAC.1